MRFSFVQILAVFALLLVMANTSSCKKERILTTGGSVSFSTDTLKFDTVFTAAGSFTRAMAIYNNQNETVILSSVRLKNGNASFFKLNVDGFQGNNVTNLKIKPRDSIYVFATVKIDPTDTLTPFLITDSLITTLNGQEFYTPVTAYGQNAHYVIGDSIRTNTTWLTDKPYVVIRALPIGPGATLNIPANCRVYMHQDARFFVYGTLNINPTGTDSVVFQGDRLDRSYFGYLGYPGEWGGIYVVDGGVCNIKNAVIKNCGGSTPYHNYGIQPAAVEVDEGGLLTMANTTIKNSIGHGIFSFKGEVNAVNCEVTYCGGNALAVIYGGKDSFQNCTFANYGNYALTHSTNPTLGVVNWLQISQDSFIYADLNVVLQNCIVWGSLDSEMVCDTSGSAYAGITNTRLKMDHCIIRRGNILQAFVQQLACKNEDPQFIDYNKADFHISASSPAVNAGKAAGMPARDRDGKLRSGADIGCYQH